MVPVMATIGIRPVSPFTGNNLSTTGAATFRGNPVVGARCILNPGPALTSNTAPPVSDKGLLMSLVITSIPQISRSIILEIRSAMATLAGCTISVTSSAVPPVLRLAVSFRISRSPSASTESSVYPASSMIFLVRSFMVIMVSTFSCPYPLLGSLLTSSTNSLMVELPSPITCAGVRLAAATNWLLITRSR